MRLITKRTVSVAIMLLVFVCFGFITASEPDPKVLSFKLAIAGSGFGQFPDLGGRTFRKGSGVARRTLHRAARWKTSARELSRNRK